MFDPSHVELSDESPPMKVIGKVAGIVCWVIFGIGWLVYLIVLVTSHVFRPQGFLASVFWFFTLSLWGMPFARFPFISIILITAIIIVVRIFLWFDQRR